MLSLYIRWCEKKNKNFYSKQLEEEFIGLYPGRNTRKQIYEYYLKKTENAIKYGIVGIWIVMICVIKQMTGSDIKDGKYLVRNLEGEGDKEYILEAEIAETEMKNVVITVGEQEKSETEKQSVLDELEKKLEEVIKGENEDLRYVTKPLNLIATLQNFYVIYYTYNFSHNTKVLRHLKLRLCIVSPDFRPFAPFSPYYKFHTMQQICNIFAKNATQLPNNHHGLGPTRRIFPDFFSLFKFHFTPS